MAEVAFKNDLHDGERFTLGVGDSELTGARRNAWASNVPNTAVGLATAVVQAYTGGTMTWNHPAGSAVTLRAIQGFRVGPSRARIVGVYGRYRRPAAGTLPAADVAVEPRTLWVDWWDNPAAPGTALTHFDQDRGAMVKVALRLAVTVWDITLFTLLGDTPLTSANVAMTNTLNNATYTLGGYAFPQYTLWYHGPSVNRRGTEFETVYRWSARLKNPTGSAGWRISSLNASGVPTTSLAMPTATWTEVPIADSNGPPTIDL